MTRRKKREKKGQKQAQRSPEVHVKVAYVDQDLRGAATLVKPALLYADRVTIYSPVVSLVRAVHQLGSVTKNHQRVLVALDLIQAVPALASQLDAPPEAIDQLRAFLSVGPRQLQRLAGKNGQGDAVRAIDGLRDQLAELARIWETELPQTIEQVVSTAEAAEMMAAMDARAVELADLTGGATSNALVADSLRAATGDGADEMLTDVIGAFVGRVVEMLTEGGTFPLLDASSASLVRALEREGGLEPSPTSMRRGAEARAAADFMGYLPNFIDLSMDEVLDFRSRLRSPLTRFRAEMASLAREFEARPIDPSFGFEVEDAWRSRVEPALQDIREALAEHGLLREIGSVASGDPRRLFAEAGGVVAAGYANLLSLSGIMTAAVAAGIPVADIVVRALEQTWSARHEVRRSAFYFLHRVAEEAERTG